MTLRRKWEEKIFHVLSGLVTLIIIFVLVHLIWSIVEKGASYLSWDIVSKPPKGTFYFGGEGIPSIVYGAFGFLILMYLGYRNSLGAGILTVAALISPIMIRAMDEVLKTIPIGLQEAAYAMGSTKTETAYKVFFRQALPGLATAILLAFGRGIGDAASVLFTAGYTDNIPTKLSDPTATLPLTIYYQLQSPSEDMQNLAYTAAIILTFIVLCTSVTARLLYRGKK